jgi:hypothetical protein
MIFFYFNALATINPGAIDFGPVLTLLKSAGFENLKVPSFMSTWFDALGKHVNSSIQRTFIPYSPSPDTNGDYFDNYFLSSNTAHLLPNFKLLQSLVLLFSTNPAFTIPVAYQPRNVKLGNPLQALALNPKIPLARSNAYKSPGASNLINSHSDILLQTVVMDAYTTVYADPLLRYISATSPLLTHLSLSVAPLFLHIDCFTVNVSSVVGNDFLEVPLKHVDALDPVIPAVNIAGDPNVPQTRVTITEKPSFNARVYTRNQIVNGHVDSAVQAPVVRIAFNDVAIVLGEHEFVDPQHAWFTESMEFHTPTFTLSEARTYFRRK